MDRTVLESSGMITHLKTVSFLRENDWFVSISPYYYDNTADIVKEIDIVAEKQFNSGSRDDSSVQVNVQLFIECKYINQEIVFWFDDIDRKKAIDRLEKNTGLDIVEIRRTGDIVPAEFHYLREQKAAKLFSANVNKEDVVYKAISQCLKAQAYYEQSAARPIKYSFLDHPTTRTKIVRYPVVVCDKFSNLKEVSADIESDSFPLANIDDSFLLETNYIYLDKIGKTHDSYSLIDFINLDSLSAYLGTIEKEALSIKRSMGSKYF